MPHCNAFQAIPIILVAEVSQLYDALFALAASYISKLFVTNGTTAHTKLVLLRQRLLIHNNSILRFSSKFTGLYAFFNIQLHSYKGATYSAPSIQVLTLRRLLD